MRHLPTELLLVIFKQFLPPLVTGYDTAAASDMPLEEQVKLFGNLVFCNLVCRRWREILKDNPSLFSRDALYVTEGTLASRDGLRAKRDYVKRLVVGKVNRVGSTSDRFLAFFPNVAYVTWTCGISWDEHELGCQVAYPPLKNLRRLDWKLCGDFKTSANSFIKLVQNSPVLEYITVTEAETPLNRGGGWQIKFDIPDSVTTIGLFFRISARNLGFWVERKWSTGPSTSLKHIITSGSFRPRFSFSTIELRPDPCSITKPVGPGLQNFLPNLLRRFLPDRLPRGGPTEGTLIYSVTTYPPPASYDLVMARRLKWVRKIVLKTSGSSHRTEGEMWDAINRHLQFIFDQFRTVKSIDLCDDFQKWRQDKADGNDILKTFEQSAQGFGIAVRYIK
jgi:hypothetical protein